ncbi:MAG: hypothetical protein H7144_06490, partial [Burkholderiales bacterium]|nr:hypothetical protein [Phycisphaerae bacterium]
MALFRNIGQRRAEIRKNRPDLNDTFFGRLLRPEYHLSLMIAVAFVALATCILMLRPNVMGWRIGQYVPHDVVARVDFTYHDDDEFNTARNEARFREPRVYRAIDDPWKEIAEVLAGLPELVKGQQPEQLAEPYRSILDRTCVAELQTYTQPQLEKSWKSTVDEYIASARNLKLI